VGGYVQRRPVVVPSMYGGGQFLIGYAGDDPDPIAHASDIPHGTFSTLSVCIVTWIWGNGRRERSAAVSRRPRYVRWRVIVMSLIDDHPDPIANARDTLHGTFSTLSVFIVTWICNGMR
jgi:hypothetical protein